MLKSPVDYRDKLGQLFEYELVNELLSHSKFIEVDAGERIINSGQIIRKMPFVLEGTIKVSRIDDEGNEILLYYLMPFETCAMTLTCCMQHFPSEIQAVAESSCRLLGIPLEIVDRWMNNFPSWKSFVMRTMKIRFDELLKTIDQIAFQKLDDRLIFYLKEKARVNGSTLLNLSHNQIAEDLASSRVVISRLLKKLEQDKKLLLYRNQIKLLQNFG